jgi:hypothetical protein
VSRPARLEHRFDLAAQQELGLTSKRFSRKGFGDRKLETLGRSLMRVIAIVCNIIFLIFTSLVIIGEGVSNELTYQVYTIFLLMVPIISTVILLASKMPISTKSFKTPTYLIAMILNFLMLAFSIMAIVDQYPHPEEHGFVAYVAIVFFVPIINTLVLFRFFKNSRQVQGKSAVTSDGVGNV